MSFPCKEHDRNQQISSTVEMKFGDLYSPFDLDPITLAIRNDTNFCIQTALFWIRSAPLDFPPDQYSSVKKNGRRNSTIDEQNSTESYRFKRADQANLELLYLHRDRLAAAAEQIEWHNITWLDIKATSLSTIREAVEKHTEQLQPLPSGHIEFRKVRITINHKGTLSIDSIPIGGPSSLQAKEPMEHLYIPSSLNEIPESTNELCKVYLDRQPSQPSILTSHKTSHRLAYDSARNRLGLSPKTPPTSCEVLLYNHNNEIFDGSSCTVYFRRDGSWITPSAICGTTLGTTRRLALEKGLCEEGSVELKDLVANETMWLSNAVRGFFRGVLMTDFS